MSESGPSGAHAGRSGALPVAAVALVALFVTALVTAQLTAAKILLFGVPVSLPVVGPALALPGAALAYAVTFFASDCYSELFGRRAAQTMVNVGFVMNFVLLALVWGTIAAPAADPEFAAQFASVLGASTNIVAGSLLAYLVSQNWDVVVFHRIREATDGDALWLRNIGSTATSQLLDTVVFVVVAFAVAPAVLGVGPVLSGSELLALVVGQYLLKLLIAVVDTPFVYVVVRTARNRGVAPRVTPSD